MNSTRMPASAWWSAWGNERGVALISTLSALLLLTPIVLTLLSVSTFELLISRNLVDTTQALYSAEAGLEWAFNVVVNTPDWSVVGPALVPPAGLLPPGTTITVQRGDLPSDLAVTSTGTVGRAQRTIQALIRRDSTTAPGGSEGPSPANEIFARHVMLNWHER
jgi:Tfp pilus assembly protein PilX